MQEISNLINFLNKSIICVRIKKMRHFIKLLCNFYIFLVIKLKLYYQYIGYNCIIKSVPKQRYMCYNLIIHTFMYLLYNLEYIIIN